MKQLRDWEPSRLRKEIIRSMKKSEKLWYVTYLYKCECFFSDFLKLKSLTASKPLQNNKQMTRSCLNNHWRNNKINQWCQKTRIKLSTSGDIKLNPGSEKNLNSQTVLSTCHYVKRIETCLCRLVAKVTVFSEQFLISYMVIPII